MDEGHSALEGEIKFVRQRQNVENSEPAAQQGLARMRIPGEAQARLEVAQGGVQEERRPGMRLSVGDITQVRYAIVRFGGHGNHFIAQPGIEREVLLQVDIILCVSSKQSFA